MLPSDLLPPTFYLLPATYIKIGGLCMNGNQMKKVKIIAVAVCLSALLALTGCATSEHGAGADGNRCFGRCRTGFCK